MIVDWWMPIVGVAGGLVLGARGFAVPVSIAVVWWLVEALMGNFAGTSGGDNVAAEAAVAGVVGAAIGTIGVVVGLVIRSIIHRTFPPRSIRRL